MIAGVGLAGDGQIEQQRPRFLIAQRERGSRNLGFRRAEQTEGEGRGGYPIEYDPNLNTMRET